MNDHEFARHAARAAGDLVVFTGRDHARVEALASATNAHGLVADVTSASDNARVVAACQSAMGGVDVLINNAGYAYRGEIGALDKGQTTKGGRSVEARAIAGAAQRVSSGC